MTERTYSRPILDVYEPGYVVCSCLLIERRTLDRAEHVEITGVVLMRCLWLPLQRTALITSDRAVSGRKLSWVCSRQSRRGLLLVGKPKYSIRDLRTQMRLPAAVMQRWRCLIQSGRYCVSRGRLSSLRRNC